MKQIFFGITIFVFTLNLHAADFYWIGGDGDWSDENHWSSNSGGTPGTLLPAKGDNVFFDDNSGLINVSIINVDVSIAVDTIDFSALSNDFEMHSVMGSDHLIYGSIIGNSFGINF